MTDEEYRKSQVDIEEVIMARPKQSIPQAIEPIPMDEVINPMQAQADRDIANQLLGRIQLGQGIAKLVTVTTLLDLKKIKESKLYKHLPHLTADEKVVTVTSWAEFCKLLGRSVEQVDEDLRNLDTFGAEALESMQQMGLGYRQLRQLRKLPEDDRTLIIEQVALDTGDKDAVQDLILGLLATQSKKHNQEKTELEAKLEVKDKVIAQKTTEIQKRDKTVAELEAANAALTANDNGVDGIDILNNKLADRLSTLVNKTLSVDLMLLRKQIIEIQQANAPEHIQLQCGQAVVQLIAELQSIQAEYQLGVPSVIDTSWMANIPEDAQDD